MKLAEYAILLGCTYRTAQNHYKQGLIPDAFKVGSVIYVPDNVIELLREKNGKVSKE
jgi:predicted site-specific integrase-resolvase